jgi:hypothetical protein
MKVLLWVFGSICVIAGGWLWYITSYNASLCNSGMAMASAQQCSQAVGLHQKGIIAVVIGGILLIIAFIPSKGESN